MNSKILAELLLVSIVILTAAPTTFARPEYLTNLTDVYGTGSCDTCHINGASDGPRTDYGTLFESQPEHATDPSTALTAIGAPPSAAATSTVTATMAATPGVTAGTPPSGFATGTATGTAMVTATVTAMETPTSGFTTGTATETATPGYTSGYTTETATPQVTTGITTETATAGITTGITTETATPQVTTITATTTPRSPGFGVIVSIVGLFAWAILERRKNR